MSQHAQAEDFDSLPSAVVPSAPNPEVLSEVREYYSLLLSDYTARVTEIERFLGFAEGAEALGTRLHKVESFLKING